MPELTLAPIETILKENGANRVSKDATMLFADLVEQIAQDIAKEAVDLANHAGRKTLLREDVKLAYKKYVQ